MLDAPNIQWPAGAPYLVGDRGTQALAVRDIAAGTPETVVATEDFEAGAAGTGTWTIETNNPHSGANCLRSAVINHGQDTQQTFVVPVGAASLRFWHRVSSEAGFDFFEVYQDNVSTPNRLLQVSGVANTWVQATVTVADASSVIVRYVKDSSVSAGLDAAFIDDLEWLVPAVPAVQNYEPFHLTPDDRLKADVAGTVRTEPAAEFKFAPIAANTSGNTVLVAAVPGKRIRVVGYLVTTQTANSATNVQFRDGASTVVAEFMDLDGQFAPSYAGGVFSPAFETSVGNALNIHLQSNKLVRGHITYVEVD